MIAYTPGVWDVLHFGHVNVIRKAKDYGDRLIVGVCSDRLCRAHGKNPIVSEQDRADIVAALRWVSKVHIYDNAITTHPGRVLNRH
jgi:cytidyltransferase-like protein